MAGTETCTMITVIIVIIGMINQFAAVKGDEGDDDYYDEYDVYDVGHYLIVPPQIERPVDEEVLRYGETWNITCKCDKSIVWKPFDSEYHWDPPNIAVSSYNTNDSKMPFGSMLTITNASALMVGRYYCVHYEKQNEELDEMIAENVATSIYVYVKDPYQLVVPELTTYYHYRGEIVVLCKPSHPDVVLQLCDKTSKKCMAPPDPTRSFFCVGCNAPAEIYCKANERDGPTLDSDNSVMEPRKPTIKSNIGDHVPIGKTVRLACSFEEYRDSQVRISWKTPPNFRPAETDKSISVASQTHSDSKVASKYYFNRDLVIANTTFAHNRTYRCEVLDDKNISYYHNFKLHVRETPDDFVILSAHNRTYIHRTVNKHGESLPIEIIVQYKSYPTNVTYEWLFNNRTKISSNDIGHYSHEITEDYIKLKINQPKMYHQNRYTLLVYAGTAMWHYTTFVFVHEKPSVKLFNKHAVRGETVEFLCSSEAYPHAHLSFMFQPCKEAPWGNCSNVNDGDASWQQEKIKYWTVLETRARYNLVVDEPGIIYCKANNSEGTSIMQSYLLLQNVSNLMALEIINPKGSITFGDNVTIICSAIIVDGDGDVNITFKHNGKKQKSTTIYEDSNIRRKQLTMLNVGQHQTGDIDCYVSYQHFESRNDKRSIKINVKEAIAPHLRSGEINQTIVVDALEPIQLVCDVIGAPKPDITWVKDGTPVAYNMSNPRNTSSISFDRANPIHSGLYECIAENKKGKITVTRNLSVKSNQPILYSAIVVLLLLLITFVLTSLFFYKKMKQSPNLANLLDSNFECYNPEIVLNEQADLLPYNRQYEFPKERLKLLAQLGMGAFGVVMKAKAIGIKVHEETTTVAVKIVKNKHDDDSMRALLSELKIMVHLGRHLNVVNLLGAVTQNISNHELMVIVEYCPYGNLQDYLQKHRERFMNQVSRRTDEIIRSNSDGTYQYNVHGLKYVSLAFSTENIIHPSECLQNNDVHTEDNHNTSAETNSEELLELSNLSSDDTEAALRSINTTDLICWAAQVANGMEYLASRKVMHGDLAARNILLCKDNVVKICDFGLARSIYRRNVYKKKGEAILPFKWLAIECIADNVFSTHSDVWAYGIVLWELFSLGSAPYPGLEANMELYKMLKDGYRMEKPTFANQKIYKIMLNCWANDPHGRPTFQDLRCQFNAMMPEEIVDRLLKLNEPYVSMNAANIKTNGTSSSSSFDLLEKAEEVTAQDYVNVTESHTRFSSDASQTNPDQELEPKMDADKGTASNNDDDVDQMPMILDYGDPCWSQIMEPGYMNMNKVRKTGEYNENTPSGSSKMQDNSKTVQFSIPNGINNPCYIEIKRLK